MNLEKYSSVIDFAVSNKEFVQELSKLACSVISNGDGFILSKKVYKKAADSNILNSNREFTSKEYLQFFYAIHYIEEKTGTYTQDSDWLGFFDFLGLVQNKVFRETLEHEHLYLTAIIINRIKGIDILKIIIKRTEEVPQHIRTSIFSSIPYLVSSIDNIINSLLILTEGIKLEDNYLDLNRSLHKLAFQNSDFCTLLIEQTKKFPEKSTLLVPFAFQGLTEKKGISETKCIIESLLKEKNKESQQLGLKCLSLSRNLNEEYNVIIEFSPLLNDIENNGDDSAIVDLLHVYYRFKENLPIAKQKIIDITLKKQSKDAFHAASSFLFLSSYDETFDKSWAESILNILICLKDQHVGTFRNIEMALKKFLEKDLDLVINYLTKFIEESENDLKNIKGFKNVFLSLANSNIKVLEKIITLWLNNDSSRFHNVVHMVCSELWIQNKKVIRLDKETLDTLSDFDLEFILMKIAGYIHSKDHLESLVYSVLERKNLNHEIKSIVIELFCFHISYNYSGTIDFLKQKKPKANKAQKEIIKSILEYNDARHQPKKKKPNELLPSEERMRVSFQQRNLDALNFKDNSCFKEPSFFDMVTKISLKFGGSFFTRNEYYGNRNRYNDNTRSKLGHISHSFEMPTGEFTDPIGQRYSQYLWRIFKRRK